MSSRFMFGLQMWHISAAKLWLLWMLSTTAVLWMRRYMIRQCAFCKVATSPVNRFWRLFWKLHRYRPPVGRDVTTVRVSFSGSSVLNRVYIFRCSCLKQGPPRKSSPFLPLCSHNFRWFRAPSLKCVKTQTYAPFLVFWIRPAWSSLEQGKKLQTFS